MSENAATEGPATPQEGADGESQELSTDALREALAKARKDAANYRTKVRELEPKAAKADELENAGRSETERLTEKVTAAEARAAELEAKSTRLEVAFEKGLTPAQAKRLVGSTREELEADADEILRDFPAPAAGARKPAPDPAQGRSGSTAATTADMFAAAVDGAFTR